MTIKRTRLTDWQLAIICEIIGTKAFDHEKILASGATSASLADDLKDLSQLLDAATTVTVTRRIK